MLRWWLPSMQQRRAEKNSRSSFWKKYFSQEAANKQTFFDWEEWTWKSRDWIFISKKFEFNFVRFPWKNIIFVTEIKIKIHNQQSLTITFFTHLPNFLILIIQNSSSNRICNYDDSYEFIFLYAMLEIESLICSYHLNTLLDGYKEN